MKSKQFSVSDSLSCRLLTHGLDLKRGNIALNRNGEFSFKEWFYEFTTLIL